MAGGLFGKPFVLNVKCIIFSLISMGLFLYKPKFQSQIALYIALFILFILSYVGMAWYDYYFDCTTLPLKKSGGITDLMKPKSHIKEKQELGEESAEDKTRKHILVYLLHILFVVPLLAYIAMYKNKANTHVYPLVGVLSTLTAIYHGASLVLSAH